VYSGLDRLAAYPQQQFPQPVHALLQLPQHEHAVSQQPVQLAMLRSQLPASSRPQKLPHPVRNPKKPPPPLDAVAAVSSSASAAPTDAASDLTGVHVKARTRRAVTSRSMVSGVGNVAIERLATHCS
jgi:hypothetical protein